MSKHLRFSFFLWFLALFVLLAYQIQSGEIRWVHQLADYLHWPYLWVEKEVRMCVERWVLGRQIQAEYTRLKYDYMKLLLQYRYRKLYPCEKVLPPFKGIPARIVLLYPSIVLNRGSRDGVSIHDAVVSQEGLLGLIQRVTPHESVVLPLMAKGVAFSASTPTGHALILEAKEQGYWVSEHLPLYLPVSRGMVLVTNGLDGLYPPGIPVGIVEKIAERKREKTIWVRPKKTFSELPDVWIVQSHG